MDIAAVATVFAVVFLAELPDKSALASLILGTRYRPLYVFAGVAAAFLVHVVLAVVAGGLLTLLPHRVLNIVVAVLFAAGAVLLLRGRHDEDEQVDVGSHPAGLWRVAATSFMIIFVAEFGDLTQVLIAGLAARYRDPVLIGVVSLLAVWAVAGLAIVGGRGLLKVIPLVWITRAAALIMAVLAVVSAVAAIP